MAANTYTTYGVAAGDSSEGLVRVIMEGDALAQPSEQAMEEALPASRFVDGTAALELEPYPGTVQVWRGSVSEANLMDEADYVVEGSEISIGELQSDPVALVSYDTTVERELTRADFAGGAVELGGEPSSLTLTEDGEPVAYTLDGSTLYVAGMAEPDGYVVATYTHPVELTCYPGETTLPDAPDSIVVVGRTLGDTPSEEPVDDYELSGAVLVLPSTYEEYGVSYDAPMEERWSLSGQVEDIPAPDSEEGETGSLEPSQELVGHLLQWEPEGLVVTVDGEVTVGYTLDGQTLTVAMPSVEDRLLELSCTMAEELLVTSSALREPYVLPSLPSGEVSVTIGGSEVPCTLDGLELTVPSLQAGEYVVSYTGQAPQEAVEMACIPSVSEGEAVVVTVVDGVPMVTGTVGSGDSMQGQVDDAVTLAVDASTAADAAQEAAEAAERAANAVNQHFWTDTDGVHVTEVTQEAWQQSPSGANQLSNSQGILLRDGLTNFAQLTPGETAFYDGSGNTSDDVVATFGTSGSVIGKAAESHAFIDYHSLQMVDNEGNTYFYVSDLRDTTGKTEITQLFYGDGETTVFYVSLPIDELVSATVGGATVAASKTGSSTITFAVAPARALGLPNVEVTYTTTSSLAKAYTLGVRRDDYGVGAFSVAEGQSDAAGFMSHSENSATALGELSHAEGNATTYGVLSHAENTAVAIGYQSHAEGSGNAPGDYAHSENSGIAEGDHSHAEGRGVSSGDCSHAEGDSAYAYGSASHAQNSNTIANGNNQTAMGRYNVADTTSALIIGNGADDNARSNALTVDWSGNVNAAGNVTAANIDALPTEETVQLSNATATTFAVRRARPMCTLYAQQLNVTSALASGANVSIGTIPSGYRPPHPITVPLNCNNNNSGKGVYLYITTAGAVSIYNRSGASMATNVNLYGCSTWVL